MPVAAAVGHRGRLEELLGGEAKVEIERRHFAFRFRSAEDFFETFKDVLRPDRQGVGGARRRRPGSRSATSSSRWPTSANRNTDGALTVDSEYLEVVATKR